MVFTKALYASRRGHILNGKYVRIIDVYHEEHENVTCRAEHHRNCGFAHGEVLDQAQQDAFLSQLHQQYRQEMDAQMEGSFANLLNCTSFIINCKCVDA